MKILHGAPWRPVPRLDTIYLLASRIVEARLEEATMIERMKRIWIPGLFVVIVSTVLLGYTTRRHRA